MGQPDYSQKILAAVIILLISGSINGTSVDKDLTLTFSQKKTLDKFRSIVLPLLPHDYMKEDIFLIRWLRARNFNIDTATDFLKENLSWRKENKMDSILDEDWSDYESRFKTSLDGVDKFGRPTYYVQLKGWELRKAVISGELKRVIRYLDRGIEAMVTQIRKLQSEGKNITQYNFIADVGGFSITQHGCLQCLPMYTSFAGSYELHYPGMADKIIIVNAPTIFEVVLNVIRPVLSPASREALKVYGTNKKTYASELFNDIDRNQLPPEVGGTNYDF